MRRRKQLEDYEATEAHEIIRLLAAVKPQHEARAPANFRAKVLSQVARRQARRGGLAWVTDMFLPAWAPALAAGLVLSLGLNAWLGVHLWEGHEPAGQQTAQMRHDPGDLPFNAAAFQAGIHSQTPLGTLVAAHTTLEDQAVAFGFARAATANPARVGMFYVEALAALHSGDLQLAARRLTGLERTLRAEHTPASLGRYTTALRSLVERHDAADLSLEAFLVPFETVYTDYITRQGRERLILFQFGAWLGNMALAAAAGDQAALRQGNITPYFLTEMQHIHAPKGTLDALNRLQQLLGQPTLTEREVTEVLTLTKKAQQLLG